MTSLEILLGALQFYQLEIISVNHNRVRVPPQFEIEVEENGLYKLTDDGYIVAPFDDVNDLCRFILT
jgi:hypothetical protein